MLRTVFLMALKTRPILLLSLVCSAGSWVYDLGNRAETLAMCLGDVVLDPLDDVG